jgi:hypothetical protein
MLNGAQIALIWINGDVILTSTRQTRPRNRMSGSPTSRPASELAENHPEPTSSAGTMRQILTTSTQARSDDSPISPVTGLLPHGRLSRLNESEH